MGSSGGNLRKLVGTTAVILAALACAAPASAQTTRYASPGGMPTDACTVNDPCDIITAVDASATPGDVVQLQGGVPPAAPFATANQVIVGDGITLQGSPGGRPVISSTNAGAPGIVLLGPGSLVRDLVLDFDGSTGLGALALQPGALAERVEVDGGDDTACRVLAGTTIRDSICRSGSLYGVLAQPGDAAAVTLRNVTAVGEDGGIRAEAMGGAARTVDATNVIAFGGGGGADIIATGVTMAVTLAYSNWNTQMATAPATITSQDDAGSVGNLGIVPVFVNQGAGNYRQAATSTGTIDRGTATGLLAGELDFEGNGRFLGTAPDIGADEFVPPIPPSAATAETGLRAAALADCKRKAKKKDWSKKRRKRCRAKAEELPL